MKKTNNNSDKKSYIIIPKRRYYALLKKERKFNDLYQLAFTFLKIILFNNKESLGEIFNILYSKSK